VEENWSIAVLFLEFVGCHGNSAASGGSATAKLCSNRRSEPHNWSSLMECPSRGIEPQDAFPHRRERVASLCRRLGSAVFIDTLPKRMRKRALKRRHTPKLRMGRCLFPAPTSVDAVMISFLRSRASLCDVDWSRCELSRRGTSSVPLAQLRFN